jgi:hypothetical protein
LIELNTNTLFYQKSRLIGTPAGKFHIPIITKDADSGGLSVTVESSSKAEIQCKDNKDGIYDVTY